MSARIALLAEGKPSNVTSIHDERIHAHGMPGHDALAAVAQCERRELGLRFASWGGRSCINGHLEAAMATCRPPARWQPAGLWF